MDNMLGLIDSQEFIALLHSQFLPLMLNFLSSLGTIFVGFWLSAKGAHIVHVQMRRLKKRIDPTLAPIATSTVRYAGYILTLVIALGQFGIQTASIIAVLGAAGLAIGLALQGTLSNVAAGMMLLLLRPFKAEDWIETGAISGTVKEIGLFTTQIDTFDGVFISVPNSAIWSGTITNHSRHGTRRLDLDIGISYESDLDQAEKAMLSLTDDSRISLAPAPQFLVVSYADCAIIVRLRLYALYDDFFDLHWDLNRRLKNVLDKAGIDIPYPQLVVTYPKRDAPAPKGKNDAHP